MIQTDFTLDAKGLACPMPIVRTRKAIKELDPGQVMEIQSTDKGSTADLKAWADSAGHQYLGTTENDGYLQHYLRKSNGEEQLEKSHPHIITNDELQELLEKNLGTLVLDVREAAEFAFGHIPGAQSLPLGELQGALESIQKDTEINVVCRTGSRSDMASQLLAEAGFSQVKNVLPGMSEWTGPIEKTTK